jgi:hypothetical protein
VLDETAARFALLGDPTRLHLLSLLCERGECFSGRAGAGRRDLDRQRVAAPAPADTRRVRPSPGRNLIYYRVVEESIEQLCAIVCASVQDRARLVASTDRGQ